MLRQVGGTTGVSSTSTAPDDGSVAKQMNTDNRLKSAHMYRSVDDRHAGFSKSRLVGIVFN